MSQPRQTASRNSKRKFPRSRLDGVKCTMLPGSLHRSLIDRTCQPSKTDQTISASETLDNLPPDMAEILPFSSAIASKPLSTRSASDWQTSTPHFETSTGDSQPSSARLEAKLRRLVAARPDGVGFLEEYFDDLLGNDGDNGLLSTGTDAMKSRSAAMRVVWQQERPAPGWNSRVPLQNPRTPAVPASLDLTLEEYYAAAALVGILGAQQNEPDMEWAADWAHQMGATMAAESRKRRKRRGR